MKTTRIEFAMHDIRVVDSDTLEAWVQVSFDIRQRWKIRIKGVEGGESGTDQGAAGTFSLMEELTKLPLSQPHFIGFETVRDQHGRHVGDVMLPNGDYLSVILLAKGTHWRRSRDGTEHPRSMDRTAPGEKP